MTLKFKSTIAAFVLAAGMFVSCTQDEEKVDEVVTPETADSPGAPDDLGSLDGVSDLSADTVYFGFDDYTLSSTAQATLDALAAKLKANPAAVVQIEGHCDERGSIEYNLALGERRAQSVRSHLMQLGLDSARLTTISYGEEKPAVDGHDEASWDRNRRAEFVLSAQ